MPGAPETLAQLPVGAEAIIDEVRCERAVARRLMEMGVLPGTRVAVVRVAPLGDPLEIALRSYSLSLRRRDAEGIVLRAVHAPAAVVTAQRTVP